MTFVRVTTVSTDVFEIRDHLVDLVSPTRTLCDLPTETMLPSTNTQPYDLNLLLLVLDESDGNYDLVDRFCMQCAMRAHRAWCAGRGDQ